MNPGEAILSAIGGSNREERVASVLDALTREGWAFVNMKGEAGAGPVGEAVAWRVRAYPGHRWQIIETIPHNFPRDWEKEPLHVRPSNEPVEAGESAAFDEWWAGSGRKASYASVLYDQAAWVAWKERASRARPVEEPGEVERERNAALVSMEMAATSGAFYAKRCEAAEAAVERLTRERDALAEALEQINSTSLSEVFDGRIGEIVSAAREVLAGRFDFNAHSLKVDLARETKRAKTAEADLAETREHLKKVEAAAEEAIGCFDAAELEGLSERLSETTYTVDGSLYDLIVRRLAHAPQILRAALSTQESSAALADGKEAGR